MGFNYSMANSHGAGVTMDKVTIEWRIRVTLDAINNIKKDMKESTNTITQFEKLSVLVDLRESVDRDFERLMNTNQEAA